MGRRTDGRGCFRPVFRSRARESGALPLRHHALAKAERVSWVVAGLGAPAHLILHSHTCGMGLAMTEAQMMDVVYIGLTVALFALTWGVVRIFERVS